MSLPLAARRVEVFRMRLLIVGATGGTGRAATTRALLDGHTVTAFARRAGALPATDGRLHRLAGNILDRPAVDDAVRDQDAVICVLGARPTLRTVTLFSKGTANLIASMAEFGVRRLVCVTGIGCGDSRGHGGFLYDRIVLPSLLRTIYDDKNRQEALIRASDLEWTIVRPGFLTDGPATGNFRAIIDLDGETAGLISRADVAMFLVRQLVDSRYLHETPLLTRPVRDRRLIEPTPVGPAVPIAAAPSL